MVYELKPYLIVIKIVKNVKIIISFVFNKIFAYHNIIYRQYLYFFIESSYVCMIYDVICGTKNNILF
jgi:hypothetical protein